MERGDVIVIDYEKELKDATEKMETLKNEYLRFDGVIRFLKYAMNNREEEKVSEKVEG